MPQPINIKDPESLLEWGTLSRNPEMLLQRPTLAAYFAVVLAAWQQIEDRLLLFFAPSLPNPGEGLNSAAIAVFESIESLQVRLDVIEAIIRVRYPHVLEEYQRQLRPAIRRRSKERLAIAHGSWVVWDRHPNELILEPPSDFRGRPPVLYNKADFIQIKERMNGLHRDIGKFHVRAVTNQPTEPQS